MHDFNKKSEDHSPLNARDVESEYLTDAFYQLNRLKEDTMGYTYKQSLEAEAEYRTFGTENL